MNQNREATDVEHSFWAYDRASVSNITVAARWVGPVVLDLLKASLERVVNRHPYLRQTFSEDGKFLSVWPRAEVAWSEAPAETDWVAFVEKALHEPFDLTKLPTVRSTVVQEAGKGLILVLTLPHLLSDGAGACHLIREAFDELDRALEGRSEVFPERKLIRPRTDLFDQRRAQPPTWTWSGGTPEARLSATPPEGVQDYPPTPPQVPNRARLMLAELSEEATRSLVAFCSQREVTLNAYLTAVTLVVLDSYWKKQGSSTPVKVASTVDYRSMLTVDLEPGDLGLWAGRFHLWADLPPETDPVVLARAYHSGLLTVLRRSAFYEMSEMAQGKIPARTTRFPLLKITNVGDLDERGLSRPCRKGELDWLRVFTALHRGWLGDGGFGVIPSVFRGRLNLTFQSPDPGMTAIEARALAGEIVQRLGGSLGEFL